MNQSKSHSESRTASAKSIPTEGTRAMRASLDQGTKDFNGALNFGRQTREAMMRTAASLSKATEALCCELQAYSHRSMDDTIVATRAIMGSKSMLDAFELQAEFAKTAFENYANELTKLGELFATATKDGFSQFRARANERSEPASRKSEPI